MGNTFSTTEASGDSESIDNDELLETLVNNAAGPKRVTGDQGTVEQHSLSDQLALHKYRRQLSGTGTRRGMGITFQKLIPPGSD